ncbi:MAG: hypothetical protein Q9174_007379 [Haloplaca sp. 1 TL-2023]
MVAHPVTGKKVMGHLWADETYRVFTWQSDWDYLLTLVESGECDQEQPTSMAGAKHAYFIPRDEIPRRWWNAKTPDLGGTGEHAGANQFLTWASAIPIEDFQVDVSIGDKLVRDVLRIMDKYGKAEVEIPLGPLKPFEIHAEENMGDEDVGLS